ncbi:MAG: hypothetical protein ACK5M7_19140 [Draconibacterium sp.]
MNKNSGIIIPLQKLLLLIIPAFYLFAGLNFRLILENISLRSIDPEYIYFISGLSIAEGHLKVAHIDNPGTPLQFLIALVFRITYLFRGNSMSFAEDVLSHSDLYLSIVNMVITLLLSVALLITGKYTLKKTGSVCYAILFQTFLFIPVIWYEIIGRITPELLMPLPIMAISMLYLRQVADQKEKFSWKELILFAAILGFALSIKLTMVLLFILPAISVTGWKRKLYVIVLSLIFFLIFSIPVTLQLENFWHWIRDLFLHSGQYGSGEKNIVDLTLMKENIEKIVHLDRYYLFLVLMGIALSIFSFAWFLKHKNTKGLRLVKFTFSILAAILLQVLVTSKQFQPRYFIPALLLAPVLLYFLLEILKTYFPQKTVFTGINVFLVIFFIWNINRQFGTIDYTSEAMQNSMNERIKSWHLAESFEKESIKIIVSQDYGSPFKEYALLYSTAWSANKLKPYYAEILGKLYPNTYQYTTWDGKFRYWANEFDPEKIIGQNLPVYLYLQNDSEELLNKTMLKINPDDSYLVTQKELHKNPLNHEVFYQLFFTHNNTGNQDLSDKSNTSETNF